MAPWGKIFKAKKSAIKKILFSFCLCLAVISLITVLCYFCGPSYIRIDGAGNVRILLTYLLFSGEEETFSVDVMIRNAATVIGNVRILPLVHYNETAVAWARVWVAFEADK